MFPVRQTSLGLSSQKEIFIISEIFALLISTVFPLSLLIASINIRFLKGSGKHINLSSGIVIDMISPVELSFLITEIFSSVSRANEDKRPFS